MVIAAVDDLFFKSKISTTARQLGVAIKFARTGVELLEQARAEHPSLIILDLNSRAVDPLATMGALKADAGLASIPTLGFVSHVQTDLIERARAAGVTEVLARSTFAGNLEKILRDSGLGTGDQGS